MKLTEHARQDLEMLTWQYIDDVIEVDDFRRLEDALLQSVEARGIYVDCTMLHALLIEHYRRETGVRRDVRIAADPFLSQLLDDTIEGPTEIIPGMDFDDEDLTLDDSSFPIEEN